MMTQFRIARAVYAGYTRYYLVHLDADGYNVGETNLYTEYNNISLYQR